MLSISVATAVAPSPSCAETRLLAPYSIRLSATRSGPLKDRIVSAPLAIRSIRSNTAHSSPRRSAAAVFVLPVVTVDDPVRRRTNSRYVIPRDRLQTTRLLIADAPISTVFCRRKRVCCAICFYSLPIELRIYYFFGPTILPTNSTLLAMKTATRATPAMIRYCFIQFLYKGFTMLQRVTT